MAVEFKQDTESDGGVVAVSLAEIPGGSASMAGMTSQPRHARPEWTGWQIVLAAACALIGVAVAAFGFLDLYLTVTHLIYPYWGTWSWTVILLTEGSALGCYLGWLLRDLREARRSAGMTVFLAVFLSGFAAVSLALNLYAGRASVPD